MTPTLKYEAFLSETIVYSKPKTQFVPHCRDRHLLTGTIVCFLSFLRLPSCNLKYRLLFLKLHLSYLFPPFCTFFYFTSHILFDSFHLTLFYPFLSPLRISYFFFIIFFLGSFIFYLIVSISFAFFLPLYNC